MGELSECQGWDGEGRQNQKGTRNQLVDRGAW